MNLSAFFSFTFMTAYTPGPNNLMSLNHAGRDGFRKTLPFLAGIGAGFLGVMTVCAFFTTLLYAWIPAIQPVMRWVGAAYILFLAWGIWRDKPHADGLGVESANSFLSGMLLQWVNVKIMMYGITAMSAYVLPHYRDLLHVAGFVVLLTAIGVSGCLCWSLFGSLFQHLFRRYRKPIDVVMALLLVYCAISLLV